MCCAMENYDPVVFFLLDNEVVADYLYELKKTDFFLV